MQRNILNFKESLKSEIMEKSKLVDLIRTGEGYHLELKKNLDKSFIQEVCAFANGSGGKVILGVADNGQIIGINSDNALLSKIQDSLKQLEPPLDISISVQHQLVIIEIPEGLEKPYSCSRGFFLRIGSNSQKLKRNEIVGFFQKEGRIRFDELDNTKAQYPGDFDQTAFNRFLEISGITPSIDKKFLLENLDCLNSTGGFTNAGVLFFSKTTEFLIMQAMVVCVLYKGNEKLHILDKKDFQGNIIQNIDNAVNFIKRHTNLEYKIESLRREEIPEIPETALREAVVNAVCHRDYFEKGANVLIEIFDDRVVISNPGGLPSGLDPKDFGKKSVVRNPVIASLLSRAEYIEKIGTGINRIRDAIRKHAKGKVSFHFDSFFSVTFSRITDIDSKSMSGEMAGKMAGKVAGKVAGKIIAILLSNNKLTVPDLAEITGVSERTVARNIQKLQKENKLKRIGSARGGYWKVIE
jgi:ATP-dependent DNA helicase RecG